MQVWRRRLRRNTPPVLLVVYNRPDEARKVLQALAAARPSKLFVVSDGPKDNSVDREKVAAVRRLIDEEVDWPCEKFVRFRQENLGCRSSMANALDWFFSEVEEGIVLEDDTVPHLDFFEFCAVLLDTYREDLSVWGIGGDNSYSVKPSGSSVYGFTRYPLIWGWASWRSRWQKYDGDLSSWAGGSRVEWLHQEEEKHFKGVIESMFERGVPDSWAYPLSATVLSAAGVWIFPRNNLVENIGFGINATHTKNIASPRASVRTRSQKPPTTRISPTPNQEIDMEIFRRVYQGRYPLRPQWFGPLRAKGSA